MASTFQTAATRKTTILEGKLKVLRLHEANRLGRTLHASWDVHPGRGERGPRHRSEPWPRPETAERVELAGTRASSMPLRHADKPE